MPDGILMVYPALSLSVERPVPSLFKSFNNDQILSAMFLYTVLNCYLDENFQKESYTNFFISPVVAPDSILVHFPITRIVVGTEDPLLDYSWQFVNRLQSLQKNVLISIFDGYYHGALNFDNIAGFFECRAFTVKCIDYIKEIFSS